MKFFKALFAFYINSSIHVALAVTALVAITRMYFDLPDDWVLFSFVFLGTITGYNFVKYAKIAGLHHRSLAKSLKSIQVFSAICAVLLLVVSWQISFTSLVYASVFGMFTFFYAVPVFMGKNLRSVGGVKIAIVAIVWAGITVIVPAIEYKNVLNSDLLLLFVQRFLLVVVWILPFEIRDVQFDGLALGTMPQRMGVNRTKVVGVLLLLVALLCEFYISDGQLWKISAAGIMLIVSGILLIKAKTTQSRYYASFWVESIPVFWYLLAHFFFQLSF